MQFLHQLWGGVYTLKHSLNCVIPASFFSAVSSASDSFYLPPHLVPGHSLDTLVLRGGGKGEGRAVYNATPKFTSRLLFTTHLQLND